MNKKDLKVGMRVVPSGRGFTKHWNLSRYTGTVKEVGQKYIKVAWDGFDHIPIDDNLQPVHLSPAMAQSNPGSQADGYTACLECGIMIPIGQVLCPSHLSG